MTTLTPYLFEGREVRTLVGDDGEPRFVLADLCTVLGISNSRMVAARLDDDERGVSQADTPGGRQQVTVVTEAGMYSVIIRSDAPNAATFRRWVTHDVLPAIRRTGTYTTSAAAPALPASYAEALRELATTVEQKEALAAKVEADAPKVNYVETYVADGDLRTFRSVAASLDVGEHELRQLLLDHGWIYCDTASRWSETRQEKVLVRRYSAYSHKRAYFHPVPVHEAPRFKGEVMHTLKITPTGAEAIARLLDRATAPRQVAS